MSNEIAYEIKLKNGYVDQLTPDEMAEFLHFFGKEEIEYMKELTLNNNKDK